MRNQNYLLFIVTMLPSVYASQPISPGDWPAYPLMLPNLLCPDLIYSSPISKYMCNKYIVSCSRDHVYSHVILQIDGCEQLATESTILQNSLNLFLLGWKCQIMFQLGLSTWKGNLILVILPLFATIFEESHKKSHEKIFKHLGQHEILLGTHWNH